MTVYGVEEAGKRRLIGLEHVAYSIIWNSEFWNADTISYQNE